MRLMVFSLMSFLSFPMVEAQSVAEKDREIALLKGELEVVQKQQLTINAALAAAKKGEAESLKSLRELTNRLEALGMHEGELPERLLQAVADAQALDKELRQLREASERVLQDFQTYLQDEGLEPKKSRQKVEAALRRFELAQFGGSNQQKAPEKGGNLQSSKVVSIDSQSGMMVFNMGSKAQVKVGIQLTLKRGDRRIGEAIVVEVRPNVCGALLVSRENQGEAILLGDTAHAKLQRER